MMPEKTYMKFGYKPTKLGIYGFLVVYLLYIPLDFFAFPDNFSTFLWSKLIIILLTISILVTLELKGLFKRFLSEILIIVYCIVLISLWVLLSFSEANQIGRQFYLYFVPMMMICLSAFYYRGVIGILIIHFLSSLISLAIGHFVLELEFVHMFAHITFFFVVLIFCIIYVYWIRKVRIQIIIANTNLEEQRELLRSRIQKVGERNNWLMKQKETLNTKLNYFNEQLPNSLQGDIMKLFQDKGLINEETEWEKQAFSKRQLEILTNRFELKKDQILMLSGIYLSLTYTEIREALFPHLSIRSIENMASSLRKILKLHRGADLVEFLNSI